MGFFSGISSAAKSIGNAVSSVGSIVEPFSGLISSGLSYYGGLQRNAANVELSDKQREYNRLEAAMDREWKTYMSNSAHQREIRDLKAAGLNPILSARTGGASTPSGTPASQNVLPQIIDAVTPAVNSFWSSQQAQSQIALQQQQTGVQKAQQEKTYQEIENLAAQKGLTEEQTNRVAYEIEKMKAEMEVAFSKAYGQDLHNAQQAIVTEFVENYPGLKQAGVIAKELGIHARDFLDMFNFSIRRWIGSFRRQ